MPAILDGTAPDVDARLLDQNGVPYGVKHVDNKPRVSSMPYAYDIAEGNVTDHSVFRVFGHNDVVAAAWETVHTTSTLRTYLTAGERLQVVSSAAADDGDPVGNGARTVTIDGLDDSYDPMSETVTMNGVANVLTDASFFRVQSATVATAGTTGYNAGTITISNNADAIVLETIEIQQNTSLAASYTVKNGYTAYVTQAMATEASLKGSQFGCWVRVFGGLWTMKRTIVLLESSIVLPILMPMKLPQKTDVEIRCYAIQAGANVTAGFEGWIEAN
jgi:hypothetical protein